MPARRWVVRDGRLAATANRRQPTASYSGAESDQVVEGLTDLGLGSSAGPAFDLDVAAGDENGPRLVWDSIRTEDRRLLIQTPPDGTGGHQLCRPGGRLVQSGLPGDGNEPNPIGVLGSQFVDDGQLPPAGASPLCPEHQIDGLLLVAEGEG